MKLAESLESLNTGADLDGRASVATNTLVLVDNGDVLEAVGVDDESTPADGSAKEVMTSVADDQAKVVVLGEENTSLDVGNGLSLDVEGREVATRARISRVGGRTASVVGEVCPEASSWEIDPNVDVSSLCFFFSLGKNTTYCHCSLG